MKNIAIIIFLLFTTIHTEAQVIVRDGLQDEFEQTFQKIKSTKSETDMYFRGSADLKTYGLARSMDYAVVSVDTSLLQNECQPLSEEEKQACRNEFLEAVKMYEEYYHSGEFHFGFVHKTEEDSLHLDFSNNVISWHLLLLVDEIHDCQMSHNRGMLDWNDEAPTVKYKITDELNSEAIMPASVLKLELSSTDFSNEDFIYGAALIKGEPYYAFDGMVQIQRTIDLVFKIDTGNEERKARAELKTNEKNLFGKASQQTFESNGITYTETRTKFTSKEFKRGYKFASGLGTVDTDEGKYAIDEYGNLLDEEPFENIIFNPGDSLFYAKRNSKWGIINHKAQVLIPFIYDRTADVDLLRLEFPIINHGLIEFKTEKKLSGYLNVRGDTILPFQFNNGWENTPWVEGHKVIRKNRKGVIDSTGEVAVPFNYWEIYILDENAFAVKDTNALWWLIRDDEKQSLPYDEIVPAGEAGMLRVKTDQGLYGIVDAEGKEILECQYTALGFYSEGKIFGTKGEKGRHRKYACIDVQGNFLTDYIFSNGRSYEDSLARKGIWDPVTEKFDGSYVDHQYNIISRYKFASDPDFKYGSSLVDTLILDEYGRYSTYNGEDTFILTTTGESIRLEPKYSIWQLHFSDGLVGIQCDGLQGYADTKGRIALEPKYRWAGYWSDNKAWVIKEYDDYFWILSKE